MRDSGRLPTWPRAQLESVTAYSTSSNPLSLPAPARPGQPLLTIDGGISGGHRQVSHCLLGVPIAGLGAWGLSFLRLRLAGQDFQAGAWLMVLLLVAFAAKALRLTRAWITSWSIARAGATAMLWSAPEGCGACRSR